MTREKVKALAMAGLERGQSPKTVQNTIRCLSSLLSQAVEDGLLAVNPAFKPGKFLPKISKRRGINPLTREELATLLGTAKSSGFPRTLSPDLTQLYALEDHHPEVWGESAGRYVAGIDPDAERPAP